MTLSISLATFCRPNLLSAFYSLQCCHEKRLTLIFYHHFVRLKIEGRLQSRVANNPINTVSVEVEWWICKYWKVLRARVKSSKDYLFSSSKDCASHWRQHPLQQGTYLQMVKPLSIASCFLSSSKLPKAGLLRLIHGVQTYLTRRRDAVASFRNTCRSTSILWAVKKQNVFT